MRSGRLRTNEAITSDSSVLVLVTCDPNSRDANASVVSRSFGRDSCIGPAVALTVTSRYPFREPGPDVLTRRGPLVAVPAKELGGLGFESGDAAAVAFEPGLVPPQVQITSSFDPQYQREWLGQ